MTYRSPKENKKYNSHKHRKKSTGGCDFCDINAASEQFIAETNNFKIIRNIFPYSFWDFQKVADHLMIVPKVHTDTLSDLPEESAKEFVKLISDYEKVGYNVYARAAQSNIKTVLHQHTHLIKPDHNSKIVKTIIYRAKPYIRIIK